MPVIACGQCRSPFKVADADGWVCCPHCGLEFVPPRMRSAKPGEVVLYRDDRVRVTNKRIIIDGDTYATANITSVKTVTNPPDTAAAATFILWGVLLSLCTCGLSLVFALVGFLQMLTAKASYTVVISSASGELRSVTDEDSEQIDDIANAINEAIAIRE